MKILFIVTSLTTGGAEMMLFKILKHIDRERFQPFVICLRDRGDVGPLIEKLGIQVVYLGLSPGPLALLALPRLIRLLGDIKPDIVQTWMHHSDFLGGIAARIAGCRYVVWGLRQSNLSKESSKRSSWAIVRACAFLSTWMPTQILSCSTRAKEMHVTVGYADGKIQVIPNGFDLALFQPDEEARLSVRISLGLPASTPLVGLMARYDPQKNHIGFLEAVAAVRRKMLHTHFVLAGGGIDADNIELRSAIREMGVEDCVHLLGRRGDMPRLMAALDVLASSSSYGEGFPNVLGEAMSCGVPCVVTDVGDSAEIVGDTGRVVQIGNMQGLADQIVELLRSPPEQKMSLRRLARERVGLNYEIGHVVKLYETFYLQLAKNDRE